MKRAGRTETFANSFVNVQNIRMLNVNVHAVNQLPFIMGQPQKKDDRLMLVLFIDIEIFIDPC